MVLHKSKQMGDCLPNASTSIGLVCILRLFCQSRKHLNYNSSVSVCEADGFYSFSAYSVLFLVSIYKQP